jgi:hypothetical protein
MRSLGKGVCQPQCESVKVLSPEIILSHRAKGSVSWKPVSVCTLKVSAYPTCRGLSPWRANELSILELGRTEAFRMEAAKEPKKATKQYGVSVVGLTHSICA